MRARPDSPGLLLIQADGRHNMEQPEDWNRGDAGDPFPGTSGTRKLDDSGTVSTSFPDGERSGVTLKNIAVDADTGHITLDIKFAGG